MAANDIQRPAGIHHRPSGQGRRRSWWCPVAAIGFLISPQATEAGPAINACFAGHIDSETVEIVEVDRYGDLKLADGRTIGLADIEPVRVTGLDFIKVPTRATLAVMGQPDRWGRTPGHVALADSGGWLQQHLVQTGAARVLPKSGPDECLSLLLAVEDHARRYRTHQGNEAGPSGAILATRDIDELNAATGTYVLAEGRVVSLGIGRRYRYLNFGYRWKTDFTVTIDLKDEAAFTAFGHKPDALDGAAVRIRGVLQQKDGPWLHLEHPAQLEILAKGSANR